MRTLVSGHDRNVPDLLDLVLSPAVQDQTCICNITASISYMHLVLMSYFKSALRRIRKFAILDLVHSASLEYDKPDAHAKAFSRLTRIEKRTRLGPYFELVVLSYGCAFSQTYS